MRYLICISQHANFSYMVAVICFKLCNYCVTDHANEVNVFRAIGTKFSRDSTQRLSKFLRMNHYLNIHYLHEIAKYAMIEFFCY